MPASTARTFRFLRSWLSPGIEARRREVELVVEGIPVPATLHVPPGPETAPGPTWVVLHGITRPGRSHSELVRFCRSLAAGGGTVLVPEIREWRELELAPDRTVPVVRGAVEWLSREIPGRGAPGLVGFSFGAPQALRAAAHASLRGAVAGVVGFGGYFDIHRTVRFQLTGFHEWEGSEERLAPDPYGRWIMSANHLTDVSGHEDAGDVAGALRRLAAHAGDARILSDAPEMDDVADSVRPDVSPGRRPLFDLLFRGPAAGEGRREELERLARELADAALRVTPGLDVGASLDEVACPVELVHGRMDRLIPYTETLRLAAAFPPGAPTRVTVTRLFAHSRGRGWAVGWRDLVEGWRFVRVLRRMLALPEG